MNEVDIAYLPAVDLRELYRRREVSPVEVTRTVLERIERLNPNLNAFVTVTPERALADAQAAEAMYAQPDPPPLAGIPTSIKDLVATKGIRTTRGSLLFADDVPDHDPVFVQRLYESGIVMLGKTNTPEGGWKGDSGNRVVGPTHNPWKHGLTAGGSSGGAAAAVAAGLGPLAQGGDGAGSIRMPAAFSGIFGHKPSFGRVPYPSPSPSEIAHTGPMTRTVADAALMLDVMSGPSSSDRHSLSRHAPFLEDIQGGIAGLRVAWSPDLGFAQVDPDVLTVCEQAVQRFSELGCHVEEANPGLADPWPVIDMLFAIGQASGVADRLDEVRDKLDQGRLKVIERALSWSAVELQQTAMRREQYFHDMMAFMENYDLLVTPTMPITAFPAGQDYPAEINGVPMRYLSWTAFTYPFNLTGQPAASVPCGFAGDHTPVALQIVGRWRDDATVLRAAARFEDSMPWAGKRPPLD
jgi:aspartyl-tRNA(Asn)/glutamyl-tRNA(Gln) amidotransferase subunit A